MKRMKTWRWVPAAVLLAVGGATGRADELAIHSFDGTGRLSFNRVTTAETYRVEWAPSPAGPWTNTWDALANIGQFATGSYTCSVPMCYRVVATVTNAPAEPPPGPQGMVAIPAGTNSGTDPDFGAYSLTVEAFYMDVTEVTNDEMIRVMQWAYGQGRLNVSAASVQNAQGNQQELLDLDDSECRITWNGSAFGMKAEKGSGYPCVRVTWYGAAAYCNYRSEMDGRTACYNLGDWTCNFAANGYRLPTNTEWEYSARGGLSGKRFPWGDEIQHSRANYYSSSSYGYDTSTTRGYHPDYDDGGYPYTSPVGAFAANGYGLCDMAGNVWEWCWDASGSRRAIRGGCWDYDASRARCRGSLWISPDYANYDFGFRAVCR